MKNKHDEAVDVIVQTYNPLEEKRLFLSLVVRQITEHPDWVGELMLAIQGGITAALEQSYRDKAQIAYAFSWLVEQAPDIVEKEKGRMQKGLGVLADFFVGSSIGAELRALLGDDG
jgi:hypothetical protein